VKKALDRGENWYEHECYFSDLGACGVTVDAADIPDSTSFDILKKFVYLIGRKNISFRMAESDEMTDLIRTAIHVGQCNPNVTPESLFPKLCDNAIARVFHKVSDELSGELIDVFRRTKFVAVALDAGSIKRRSFLTILMANALLSTKPYVLRIVRNFPGAFDDYSDAIDSAQKLIDEYRLTLVGIVADNLKVQTSVVSHLSQRSTLKHNSELKAVRFFPCACHTFNLAFCDAQKSGGEVGGTLKSMCDRVQEASKILCSRPIATKLRGHCPTFCPTRWTNLSDICCFLLRDRLEILQVMQCELDLARRKPNSVERFTRESAMTLVKAIYDDAPLFIALLAPYHDFVTQMESDSMSVGFVLPILRRAVEHSFGYCASLGLGDEFPTLMQECVGRRFAGPLVGTARGRYGALYGLAELLTPSGRYAYRQNNLSESEKGRKALSYEGVLNPISPEDLTRYGPLLDWLIRSTEQRYNESRDIVAIITVHFGPERSREQLPDMQHTLHSAEQPPSEDSYNDYSESDDFVASIETDDEGVVEFSLRPSVRVTRRDYVNETELLSDDWISDSETEDLGHPDGQVEEENGNEMEQNLLEIQEGQKASEIEQHLPETEEEETGERIPPVTNVFDDLTIEHIKRELVLIARDLRIPAREVTDAFGTWIYKMMPGSVVDKMNGPILDMWQEVSNYTDLASLSEIAQRLLAVPSSEASVERAIWHQRRVLCPGSLRMSCATEEARCRFLVSTG
jgi:hypothetical protein